MDTKKERDRKKNIKIIRTRQKSDQEGEHGISWKQFSEELHSVYKDNNRLFWNEIQDLTWRK